ncbi:MAG: glycerol-3-phosphate acyltransferase [Candidatus Neomarinimicrobiota bacterium]
MTLSTLLIVLISYLVGSISGGVIIGKIRNVDIRQKGSRAAGATNAFRTMGALFAISVLVIDVYKGYFSVYYIPLLFLDESTNIVKALAGFSAILGHVFPLFFKFKGGKGVGTALGTLLAFPTILFYSWHWFFNLVNKSFHNRICKFRIYFSRHHGICSIYF